MKKILSLLIVTLAFCTVYVNAEEMQFTQKELYIKQILENNYNYSANGFFEAIKDGNYKYVDLFIKSGMDPNTTCMKVPALFFAIKQKQPSIVDRLLAAGVNPNQKFMKQTPLATAIITKNAETVNTLIKHGANVNDESLGMYPLNYAIMKKESEVIHNLINSGAKVDEYSLKKALKLKDENLKNYVLTSYKKQ